MPLVVESSQDSLKPTATLLASLAFSRCLKCGVRVFFYPLFSSSDTIGILYCSKIAKQCLAQWRDSTNVGKSSPLIRCVDYDVT